jgi:hypothetical protein
MDHPGLQMLKQLALQQVVAQVVQQVLLLRGRPARGIACSVVLLGVVMLLRWYLVHFLPLVFFSVWWLSFIT